VRRAVSGGAPARAHPHGRPLQGPSAAARPRQRVSRRVLPLRLPRAQLPLRRRQLLLERRGACGIRTQWLVRRPRRPSRFLPCPPSPDVSAFPLETLKPLWTRARGREHRRVVGARLC
jgi:hypothetical protein